ncbi:MAG: glycosyltransferase [Puniceicoccales bacterium]|jgi:glycosyltransferase involved in cell wall biosynthesis|nr:glycosyltransferase [Puniceicoccales bacterium]
MEDEKKIFPKISVVVPIYNVERYLRQCLDSIVSQTMRDLEIILVDDGSTDGSSAIVDEYAAKDGRIVAIHQANGGAGSAYNVGIARASGGYVGLVEGDDWIEPDMYEIFYNEAEKYGADLIKAPFYMYNSLSSKPLHRDIVWTVSERGSFLDLTKDAPPGVFCIEDFPVLATYHVSIWSALYAKDLIRRVAFVESPGASYQDLPFAMEILCLAKRIVVIPKPLLHYRCEGSGQGNSNNICDRRAMAIIDRYEEALKAVRKLGKYEVLKEELWLQAFNAIIGCYNRLPLELQREMLAKMRTLFLQLKKDASFQYKYFSQQRRRFIARLSQNKCLLFTELGWKSISRFWAKFIFSLHIHGPDFIFQILGLQISKGKYTRRPALLAWKIK